MEGVTVDLVLRSRSHQVGCCGAKSAAPRMHKLTGADSRRAWVRSSRCTVQFAVDVGEEACSVRRAGLFEDAVPDRAGVVVQNVCLCW